MERPPPGTIQSRHSAAGVLLSEFVERFDRTFLPVGEATVP